MTMKPYWTSPDGAIEVWHADTLRTLRHLRAQGRRFRCVIMDPPYASGARTEAGKPSSGAMVRGAKWATRPIENDQMTTTGFVWLMRETALEVREMLGDGDSLFAFIDWRQWPNLIGALESCDLRINAMIVWDKMSFGMGNGFRAQHELIVHASKGTPRVCSSSFGNVLRHLQVVPISDVLNLLFQIAPLADLAGLSPEVADAVAALVRAIGASKLGTVLQCKRDDTDNHPSPKPPRLMEDLLTVATMPGDDVLDPYMGGGPTLVAGEKMRRRVTGIEGVREHCDTAISRLGAITADRAAEPCGPLFAAPVKP